MPQKRELKISDVAPRTLDAAAALETFSAVYLLVRIENDRRYRIIFGNMQQSHAYLLATWLKVHDITGRCRVYGGGYLQANAGTVRLSGNSGSHESIGAGMRPVIEAIARELGITIEAEYREHFEYVTLERLLAENQLMLVE